MADGRLDLNQRLTVVKDAAEIIRGLLVLDRRYGNIPGWEPLSGAGRLQRAAEACAFIEAADYTVDRRGWRPPARTIDGPARAGHRRRRPGRAQRPDPPEPLPQRAELQEAPRLPARALEPAGGPGGLDRTRAVRDAGGSGPRRTQRCIARPATWAAISGTAAPRWPKPPTPSAGCGGCHRRSAEPARPARHCTLFHRVDERMADLFEQGAQRASVLRAHQGAPDRRRRRADHAPRPRAVHADHLAGPDRPRSAWSASSCVRHPPRACPPRAPAPAASS